MIDIEKLLKGSHITIHCYKSFSVRNMCKNNSCKYIDCKGCPNTDYYIKFRHGNCRYRLPKLLQSILRRIWD